MKFVFVVVMLTSVAACGGDGDCLTPTTWCADGAVMRCEGGTPALVEDCAMTGEAIGVEKRCGSLKASAENTCVDLVRTACTEVGVTDCAPNKMAARTCVETDFGPSWDTHGLDGTCAEGQGCHRTGPGMLVCVALPIKTCAGTYQCEGQTLERCAGNTADGFVVVETMACPSRCEIVLGAPVCE